MISKRAILLQGLLAGGIALLAAAPARAFDAAPWPDTYVARLEALASMQTLNAEILASTSATLVLEQWCRAHQLAAEPRIVARKVQGPVKPASAEQLRRLAVHSADELRFRQVELSCGDRVLSKADNWYVPARLTDAMNRLLTSTDTPFGKVVAALGPTRQTIEMKLLWTPLSDNWSCTPQAAGPPALTIPAEIFQHRALLFNRDRQPFSEVSEVYQGALLAFALPSRAQPVAAFCAPTGPRADAATATPVAQ